MSVSLPRELLDKINARATALKLPRSDYLARLAQNDVNQGGALVIGPEPQKNSMDFVKEVTEFLRIAIPALAEYDRTRNTPGGAAVASAPPESAAENQFWNDFLDERDEILILKWIESRKAGADIGFERAIQLWLEHRPGWLAAHTAGRG